MRTIVALVALVSLVVGCAAGAAPASSPRATAQASVPSVGLVGTSTPASSPGLLALRTFPVWRVQDGVPVECDAPFNDPASGVLRGDPAHTGEPLWLEEAGGRRLSVVWPEGFSAHGSDKVALYDDTGKLVANEGDVVALQVSRTSARGTVDDPYYASGILIAGPGLDPEDPTPNLKYQGCYPRLDPNRSPTP